MADNFTLADLLQGRRNPLVDQYWATPPDTLTRFPVGARPGETSVSAYQQTPSERGVSDWLVGQGAPRGLAQWLGRFAPWTPPGGAYDAGAAFGESPGALTGAGLTLAALPLGVRAPLRSLPYSKHTLAPWTREAYNVADDALPSLRNELWAAYEAPGGRLPDPWYLHGRAARGDLDTGNVLQMTRDYNVAEQYAGRNGSIWAIRPSERSRVLDFESIETPDARRVGAAALRDYRAGKLPFADDLSWMGPRPSGRDLSIDIRNQFSPDRIVDSAQAFDNPTWLEWLYGRFEPDLVRVPNGAVAFGPHGLEAIRLYGVPAGVAGIGAAGVLAGQDREAPY
jgi:hypothetical protein